MRHARVHTRVRVHVHMNPLTSSISASLFRPPCRLPQNFIKYLMSKMLGKYTLSSSKNSASAAGSGWQVRILSR